MTPDRLALLDSLSESLWRERELLDVLLFKLVEQQLVIAAGDERWFIRATQEVERVVERLQVAELGREVELAAVTRELGTSGAATLGELIEAVEEPWPDIFARHRGALLALVEEITATSVGSRSLVHTALAAAHRSLDRLTSRAPAADIAAAVPAASSAARPTTPVRSAS